ncbi:MAG: hypothetical protein CW338_07895 [Clostridiales bacterium]|nr:hypothetical protein [Clostridiales bacterium]
MKEKLKAKAPAFFGIGEAAVNRGRQPEIDLVKGLAIIFMIVDHSFGMISYTEEYHFLYLFLDEILAGYLAAPMFMFCMGVGFAYSGKQDPRRIAVRGLKMLLTAFMLNTGRFVIPQLLSYLFGRPLINNGWAFTMRPSGSPNPANYIPYMFLSDILFFAGFSMLAFALFKKLKLSPVTVFIIGVVSSFAATLLPFVRTDNQAVKGLLAFFVNTDRSLFPFLVWLIFPASGYLFGHFLLRCADKKLFYRKVLLLSLPVMALYAVCCFLMKAAFPFSVENTEYYMSLPDALFTLCIGMVFIAVCYFVSCSKHLKFTALRRFSANINTMFIISWLLISYTSAGMIMFSPYYDSLPTVSDGSIPALFPPWVGIGMGIVFVFLTDLLTILWKRRKARHAAAASDA